MIGGLLVLNNISAVQMFSTFLMYKYFKLRCLVTLQKLHKKICPVRYNDLEYFLLGTGECLRTIRISITISLK